MNYFSGSSLPDWINNSKVDNLYQPEVISGQLCCIYDVLYIQKSSTPNSECLIFILTDGKYHIPALIHPDLARDQLHLPANLKDSLSNIKGKVLLMNKSAFGAFRWIEGVVPYIIAFDWIVLNVYESAINPNITHISTNAKVKEWIKELEKSIGKKPLENNSISTLYKTKLVERKFVNFSAQEACLKFFMCRYLNISLMPDEIYTDPEPADMSNEESQVRSVDILQKRCSIEVLGSQRKKRRLSLNTPIDVDEVMTDTIEPPSIDTIQPSTSSKKHYTLDEFLTAEEYQSEVIEKMWSSEFEIPDSAIIPYLNPSVNSTSITSHEPLDDTVTNVGINNDTPTNNTPIDADSPIPDDPVLKSPGPTYIPLDIDDTPTATPAPTVTETINSPIAIIQATPAPPPPVPDLILSSPSDNEEEPINTAREIMYAEAEALILSQIHKVGATTFERRNGFAHLRNLRLQRDLCDF